MDKRSTSSRESQDQRMAMKRQSARMLTEAMVGAGLSKWVTIHGLALST